MSNDVKEKKEEVFDPSKVQKLSFKEILKKIGPGIILSGIVIGPGAITTAANLGASYGYRLMWLYILIAFMGTVYVLTTYRLSMLTGMPTIHAIRHYYGNFAAGFTGVALFLTCVFFLTLVFIEHLLSRIYFSPTLYPLFAGRALKFWL